MRKVLKVEDMDKNQYTALMQPWIESERGWGQRPDGCSLHKTSKDLHQFCEDYWAKMPEQTPDEYSRPDGSSRVIVISEELHNRLAKSENGIRLWQNEFRELMKNPPSEAHHHEEWSLRVGPSLVLYAVRNKQGQFLRSRGYNHSGQGTGKVWVDTLEEAKIYGKPGPAKARITWFQNHYPAYKTLELVKLHVGTVEVIDQTERVKKVVAQKQQKELVTKKRIAQQRIAALEKEKAEIEASMARLMDSL